MVSNFVDPDFTYHLAVAQVWGEIGRRLADSQIIPFDFRQYAKNIEENRKDFVDKYGEKMILHGINLGKTSTEI